MTQYDLRYAVIVDAEPTNAIRQAEERGNEPHVPVLGESARQDVVVVARRRYL